MRADLLGERARLTPDRTALVMAEPDGSGDRLTYRQLDERAIACARAWSETLGLAKGDRVGILAHNRVEFVAAFFAAAKCGVILVTLGTRLTAAELEVIVNDSGMRALLYDGALAATVAKLRPLVALDHWVALDEPQQPGDASHAELCGALAADGGSWQPVESAPEDIHCLLYTSGTTGRPKGVMIPHRMVLANAVYSVCGWRLRDDDVSSIFTPLYHAGGLMAFLTPLFWIGGTVVLHRGFDVAEIWRTIEAERCTVVLGVPTIWKLLYEAPEMAATDLSQVRWLISGGAPLPRYLIDAYAERGVTMKQGFGMTEVGVNCFTMTREEARRRSGSIGKPMPFTEARLVDDDGRDVADGEIGELLLRGAHVSLGYWNNSQATAAALDADGWFHSGDLAQRDEEGIFTIAGRRKEMLISGGVNVFPAEIEGVLLQHPAIADAAVVGVPDERWGEVGIAFVVARGESLHPEALLAYLGERLARLKLPKALRWVDELPRTPFGKVVKGELREQFLNETVTAEPPGNGPRGNRS
jgi:fatty-acyl-CoA synthase